MNSKTTGLCNRGKQFIFIVSLLFSGAILATSIPAKQVQDLAQYVDKSQEVPGPSIPDCSFNPSPLTLNEYANGYNPGQSIHGFGQFFTSGTGVPWWQNLVITPQIGLAITAAARASAFTNQVLACNHYSVTLTSGTIGVEIATNKNSALYEYTFPASTNACVTLDMAFCAENWNQPTSTTAFKTGTFTIDTVAKTITGHSQYQNCTLYFYVLFSTTPTGFGGWDNGTVSNNVTTLSHQGTSQSMGAFFKFTTTQGQKVQMKIGASLRSLANAQAFVQNELPDFDLAALEVQTLPLVNDKLSSILIQTSDASLQKMFYTSMYTAQVAPRNRTGDHPTWSATADFWDDQLCVWDIFRTKFPLMMLIDEDMVAGNVRSYTYSALNDGKLGDCLFQATWVAQRQGGDNATNVIAEAYMKNIGGINWDSAYAAVKFQADQQRDKIGAWSGAQTDIYGNPAKGWSIGNMGSQRTIEFALNDFAAAEMAKGLGKTTDLTTYSARCNNWKNIFNPTLTCDGFTGWMDGRQADGTWDDSNPAVMQGSWTGPFYESSSYENSFYAPHDYGGLIQMMGGTAQFVQRLENGFSKGYFVIGNEPGFLDPVGFCFAGHPDRTSYFIRHLMTTSFNGGYPGNEDCGAMSSWFVFGALGIFPIAGTDMYVIHGPALTQSTIQLKNGRTFVINGTNASATNIYIQSATLNGQPFNQCWIRDYQIKNGGTLTLVMGPSPSTWAQSGPLPPSYSTDGIPDRVLPTPVAVSPNNRVSPNRSSMPVHLSQPIYYNLQGRRIDVSPSGLRSMQTHVSGVLIAIQKTEDGAVIKKQVSAFPPAGR